MTKPITIQVAEAQAAYEKAMRDHPRSTRATKLYYRLRDLRVRQLKKELVQSCTERSSTVSSQDRAEIAA